MAFIFGVQYVFVCELQYGAAIAHAASETSLHFIFSRWLFSSLFRQQYLKRRFRLNGIARTVLPGCTESSSTRYSSYRVDYVSRERCLIALGRLLS
jgi:hypothetical protein